MRKKYKVLDIKKDGEEAEIIMYMLEPKYRFKIRLTKNQLLNQD